MVMDSNTHDTQVVAIPSPADEFVFQGEHPSP